MTSSLVYKGMFAVQLCSQFFRNSKYLGQPVNVQRLTLGVPRYYKKSLTSKISGNLRNILESLNGDDHVVGRDVCHSNLRVSRRPKDLKSFLADKISEKISEGNIKGAVRLASSDCFLIPPDAETVSILRDKYPSKAPSSSSAVTSSPTTPQYHTDESELLQAIRSFLNGSGGGLDGLKPQHLKDLVGSGGHEHESRLLKSLTHCQSRARRTCATRDQINLLWCISLRSQKERWRCSSNCHWQHPLAPHLQGCCQRMC